MFTKILLTGAVIVLALIVVPRLLGGRRGAPTPPVPTEDLVRCPACGTYRGRYDGCDCGGSPDASATAKRR